MLAIIWFILKLIGIILASVLGIFIILILIILFVPILYRVDGKKEEDIQLDAKISWLLHILYCHITYIENKFTIRLRIFGKVFYDNNRINEPKKKKKKVPKKKIRNRNNNKNRDNNKKRDEPVAKNKVNYETLEINIEDKAENQSSQSLNINNITNINTHTKIEDENKEIIKEIDTQNIIDSNKTGFFYKIKQFWRKLIGIPIKIKGMILRLYHRIKNIINKVAVLWNKWEKVKAFLHDDINKNGLLKIWRSLKKILKHIRPKKLRVQLEFGTGDPCLTGQMLGVMAVFYGYYGKAIQIIPNFENEIIEGTLQCKGSIRLFTLLIICIKLILDKNFRRLIKNFNIIKEEL
jgi:hypothetical protein